MKEKLLELIVNGFSECWRPHQIYAEIDVEEFADYLIAHGVTLAEPPEEENNAGD